MNEGESDPHAAHVRIIAAATDVVDDTAATNLPRIVVTGCGLAAVAMDALAALLASNEPPRLFQRGEGLVRVRQVDDGVVLEDHGEASLRGLLARVARWYTVDAKGERTECFLPHDVPKDILSLPEWPFPPITGITEVPVLGPGGQLHLQPGYNPDSKLWYHPSHDDLPPVPESPTEAQIAQAASLLLDELLGDFPFTNQASRATAVAALLTPFVRPAVDGPVPLILFDSPKPGTGKTLLAKTLCIPAMNDLLSTTVACRGVGEWRKSITAVLARGSPVILIDNIKCKLDSSALAAVLTTNVWTDRLLGHTKMLRLTARSVWLATGNNTQLSLEIARRTVLCRLDAKIDRPWERTKFRHPNLHAWAKEHRAQLIGAALTLVRAWIASGRPRGTRELGSFEEWCRIVGGILGVAGIPGFLGNVADLLERADDEADELRAFVSVWWSALRDETVTVDTLNQKLLKRNPLLLGGMLRGAPTEHGRRIKLGQTLKKVRDAVIGQHRITFGNLDRHGCQTYRLTPVRGGSAGDRRGIGDSIGICNARGNKDLADLPGSADSCADPPCLVPAEAGRSASSVSAVADDLRESAQSASARKYRSEQAVTDSTSASSTTSAQRTPEKA